MEKFNNANGVVQRAVQAKNGMDRRGASGGRNRGVGGMIRGVERNSVVPWQGGQMANRQEVAMARMGNWVGRDTASVAYDDYSVDSSHVGRNDRGGRGYNRNRSRSRSRGWYKGEYDDDEYDDEYDGDGHADRYVDGHDGHVGYDGGHGRGGCDGEGYRKSTPRESIEEEDEDQSQQSNKE